MRDSKEGGLIIKAITLLEGEKVTTLSATYTLVRLKLVLINIYATFLKKSDEMIVVLSYLTLTSLNDVL